jgi:putative endonuclease
VNWQLYIILCTDNSLYTGITTDIERRFRQHAEGRGARYFRGRGPRRVVFLESGHCRSTASRREMEIKKMHRAEKRRLIAVGIDEADSSFLEAFSCTSG